MSDTNTDFLPFFFQEPVYVVPENIVKNDVSEEAEVEPAYNPLGQNKQQILILVEEPEEMHLSEPNRELLQKILQALSFTLDDVYLVNVAQAHSPEQVAGDISFSTCISFGMPPEPWQFSNFFRKYEVMEDETERAFLFADALAEIGKDVEKKKQLWLSLKALFQQE